MKFRTVARLMFTATLLLIAAECPADEPASVGKPLSGPMLGKQAGQLRDDNSVKIELIWCPPGRFRMGRRPGSEPVDVTLSKGFWLGKHEVTQGEWWRVMGTAPWKSEDAEYVNIGENYPAIYVTWDTADRFCRKFTDQEREAGHLPAGWAFTLPTEAQWEYACRAGTTTAFSFGDDESKLGEYGWFRDVKRERRSALPDWNPRYYEWANEVGRKKPNPWGLCDMHGNVWEWCRDVYNDKLPGGENPVVTGDEGSRRVIRGGSWTCRDWECHSAVRSRCNPRTGSNLRNRTGSNEIGFRIALTVAE
jgi:formylglycine-generating enzyme required for sulfatase activity